MKQRTYHSFKRACITGIVMGSWVISPALAQDTAVPPATSLPPVAVDPATQSQEAARVREMQLFLSVIVETKLDMGKRRDAALSLLYKGWDDATAALVKEFETPADPSNRQVIAQAIADFAGLPPQAFIAPLLSMLQDDNADLLMDVSAALGRYQNQATVTNKLVGLAVDKALNIRIRRGAIVALGYHRNRDLVGVLIGLLSSQQPAQVRSAAANSLSRLTGIYHFGLDLTRWSTWWEAHRDLDEQRWLSSLIDNFANHASALTVDNQRITQRLVEAQRQLYLATPTEERTATLEKMLSAPELPMRLMALDLIVQRLVDQQPIGETLRSALIVALSDPSAQVRAQSAQLIRDLNDGPGADAIAQRLDVETDPTVLRAYLVAMADIPREKALGRATQLLSDVELQNAAAGVLERAIADGLVTQQHKEALTRQLRQLTAGDDTLSPKMIELLGRVATEDDWLRIAGWMDSPKDAVRIAAAEAWAASDRPLGELAKRADSQLFLPILLRAAVRRGSEGQTLIQIAKHKPQAEQLVEAWQQAMLAMAPRVGTTDVIEADRAMAEHENVAAIREHVLSAAIGQSNGDVDVQLLLARAAVRLETNQAIQAMADLGLVEARSQTLLSDDQQRLKWLTFRAAIESSQSEKAWTVVDAWLLGLQTTEQKQALAGRVMTYMVQRVNRAIEARQVDQATSQLAALRRSIQNDLPATAHARLDELAAKIKQLTELIARNEAASKGQTNAAESAVASPVTPNP